jgi:transcriptional regulator with XRE-family HTH domain
LHIHLSSLGSFSVDFLQKLARLTEGVNKSAICIAAGLPPAAISTYISRGNVPRADTVLKLSHALKVPVEWMLNDEAAWPPPAPAAASDVSVLTDDELMMELAKRYRRAAVRARDALAKAEKEDWREVAKVLYSRPFGAPIPQEVRSKFELARSLDFLVNEELIRFDLDEVCHLRHRELPGRDVSDPRELSNAALAEKFEVLCAGWFRYVEGLLSPGFIEHGEGARKELLAQLEQSDVPKFDEWVAARVLNAPRKKRVEKPRRKQA